MKRIAVAVVTVVAVLALLVAAMPFIVPGEFLRELVASKIARWTGRTVAVTGEPRLSIYPDLAITLDGLTIGNGNGAGEEAFVAADGVRASMHILPLLIGRAEFEEFELIRPRVRLVVGKDGTTNWRMADSEFVRWARRAARRTASAGNDVTTDEGVSIEPQADDVSVGRLKVTDGIILYDDLASDHREEITAIELEVVWPSVAGAVRSSGALVWRGERVEFNGSVTNPLTLIAGGTSPMRFAVAAKTLRASFTGQASDLAQLKLNGMATATTSSLRRTIEWTGTPLGTGAILGAASIAGTMLWAGPAISFDDATVELDGNRAEGALSLVFGAERPSVQGSLATEKLDLTPYAEAVRASLAAEGAWLIAPARIPFAGAFDANLRLTAGQVVIGAARFSRIGATVGLAEGTIDVDVDEGRFYGGSATGRIRAGAVGDDLVARAEIEVTDVPARTALTDLAGIDALDGLAATTLAIRSRGQTWGEFALALSGTATLNITRGTLAGIDVFEIAEMMADPLARPVAPIGGTTEFSRLTASLTIAEGRLATEDLTMTGDGLNVALSGNGSLINGLVEGKGRVVARNNDVPIAIAGRWRAPVVARDTASPAGLGDGQVTTTDRTAAPTGG